MDDRNIAEKGNAEDITAAGGIGPALPRIGAAPGRIGVRHEWDRLEEVIVGSPALLTVPGYYPTLDFGFDYQAGNEEWVRQYGGTPLAGIDPDFYQAVCEQSEGLVSVLEARDIRVHRHDPALLSPEEMALMSDLQKGYNFLFPRDPVLVIGNHVIETALKMPMRTREKFIVREIFRPLLEADPRVRYASVPAVSPSFPRQDGIYLEGGDVMLNGTEIYVGHSGNGTSEAGVRWLQAYLGPEYTVHQIEIDAFQHLDCVLSLIRPGLAIRCPDAFKGDFPDSLSGWDFINLPREEAKRLACNVFVLDKDSVIIDQSFPQLRQELESRGVTVISVPFDAVTQMGGGFRCSHHPIQRVAE